MNTEYSEEKSNYVKGSVKTKFQRLRNQNRFQKASAKDKFAWMIILLIFIYHTTIGLTIILIRRVLYVKSVNKGYIFYLCFSQIKDKNPQGTYLI